MIVKRSPREEQTSSLCSTKTGTCMIIRGTTKSIKGTRGKAFHQTVYMHTSNQLTQ